MNTSKYTPFFYFFSKKALFFQNIHLFFRKIYAFLHLFLKYTPLYTFFYEWAMVLLIIAYRKKECKRPLNSKNTPFYTYTPFLLFFRKVVRN